MARTRRSPQTGNGNRKEQMKADLTDGDMIYLAAMYESTIQGLRNLNTGNAAYISVVESWPTKMVETYMVGEVRPFNSKAGKQYWGWYLELDDRFRLLVLLKESKAAVAAGVDDFDAILYKMQKPIPLDRRQVLEDEGFKI